MLHKNPTTSTTFLAILESKIQKKAFFSFRFSFFQKASFLKFLSKIAKKVVEVVGAISSEYETIKQQFVTFT